MPQLLWDASGLAKRYYSEAGTATANALFSAAPASTMAVTFIGYAETAAILRRKFNQGDVDFATFQQTRLLLETEVLLNAEFSLLSVENTDVLDGVALTDLHNINSTDASILAAYLRYARAQPSHAPPCVLIAADRRLIRAAEAEGLRTLNPELVPAPDMPAYLLHLS